LRTVHTKRDVKNGERVSRSRRQEREVEGGRKKGWGAEGRSERRDGPLIPIRSGRDASFVGFEEGVASLLKAALEEEVKRLKEMGFVLGVHVFDALK
jgi:hypothetical protein